jgi:hypothetical protein
MPHGLLCVGLISVPASDLRDALGPVLGVDMAVLLVLLLAVEIHIPAPVRYIPTAVVAH